MFWSTTSAKDADNDDYGQASSWLMIKWSGQNFNMQVGILSFGNLSFGILSTTPDYG